MSLSGFRDVFRIKDFRRLFWGQGASALGDWVGTLAFISAALFEAGASEMVQLENHPDFQAKPQRNGGNGR